MPDLWLDVDTALSEVPVNIMPLLDDTDFKTREESVAYDAAGLELIWHFTTTGGATTATVVTPTTGGDYDWAHQDGGMYTIEIPAAGGASINNDTEGFGWFTGVATGVLPWRGPVIGFRAAGLNNVLIDSAYSATRGLAGTALPDAAADAAGGLPISDGGGLDLDTQIGTDIDAILTDTGEIGAAGAGLTEAGGTGDHLTAVPWNANWDTEVQSEVQDAIEANDLDHLIEVSAGAEEPTDGSYLDQVMHSGAGQTFDPTTDSLEALRDHIGDGTNLTEAGGDGDHLTEAGGDGDHLTEAGGTGDQLTAIPWPAAWDAEVQSEVQDAIEANKLDHLVAVADSDDPADNSIVAKLAASDGDWSGFSAATDALEAIRDRGDAAWITGGGAGITDILNVQPLIPLSIDLANTVTYRIGLLLFNALDDLPSTGEIDPGTIDIDRKAIGATSWTSIVSGAAMSEAAGLVYYDEVFDTGTGYAEGDSIRITIKGQKITVAANDYELSDATGRIFYTSIRQTMRGTDSAALEANVQTHAEAALVAHALDHLIQVSAGALKPTVGSFWDQLTNKDGGQTFAQASDSLEAIRDTAPLGTAMRGTDNAALAATALSTAVWTAARAGYLDELGAANVPADVDTLLTRLNAARAAYLDELAAGNLPADVAAVDAAIAALNDPTAAAIIQAWAEALPSDYEGSATFGSVAWILALLSGTHRITVTDDGDGTATLRLYESDGVSQWGGDAGVTTAAGPDAITGVEDTI